MMSGPRCDHKRLQMQNRDSLGTTDNRTAKITPNSSSKMYSDLLLNSFSSIGKELYSSHVKTGESNSQNLSQFIHACKS